MVSWGWVLVLFIKNEPREARLGQTRASNIFRKRKRKISFWDKQQQCERDRLAVLPLQVNGSSSNKSQTSLLVTQHSHSNHGEPNVGMHNRSLGHGNLPWTNFSLRQAQQESD